MTIIVTILILSCRSCYGKFNRIKDYRLYLACILQRAVYNRIKRITAGEFSTDSEFVHKAWADASATIANLPYEMIADKAGVFASSLGILVPETWVALRGSFVVDPDGIIKAYEVHDNSIGRDASELLRKVQAAQFTAAHGDQVCPAIDLVGKI